MLKQTVSAFLLALACCTAQASQLPDYPFIHVTGSASGYFMPDIGEIDFEVIAFDGDPEQARTLVETRVAEIRTLVERFGVAAEDLEVRDVRRYIRKGSEAAPIYDTKCTVHINVRVLASWGNIVGGLLSMPNLDSFASTFGSVDRKAIEAKLFSEALADARRKGEGMAAAMGHKLGPVTAMSTGSLKNLGNAMGLVATEFFNRQVATDKEINRKDMLSIELLKMAAPVDVIFKIK